MGYFADVLAEPAAQQAGRMSYDEVAAHFAGQGLYNPFMYNTDQMARDLGFSGTARTITGYGGSPSESTGMGTEAEYGLTPDFEQFLKGYQFTPTVNGGRNAALDIYDPSGKRVHEAYRVGDHKGTAMKIAGTVIPALTAAGFGFAGGEAMGLFGGSGSGLGTFEGIGGAMAGGGAPMTAAEFTAGAGGAGAGSFALPATEFGAGFAAPAAPLGDFSLAGSSGAGVDFGANPFGDFSLAGAGTGGAGGASSLLQSLANGAKSIGGDSWLKDLISVGSGLYGMNLADKARETSDPFAKYRAGYGEKLAALEANPGSITSRPGFQAGLETIDRKSAATGYYGSGNMASALSRYSGDFYNQEATRLAGLAGAGQTPGAGQALGADLAGQSLGSIGYGLAPMLERFARGG